MEISTIWLVKLLLAHMVSDFWLQPDKWVKDREQHKIKSKYLYLHILVTGSTALLFVGPLYWLPVLTITLLHGLTDLAKSYIRPTFVIFLADQAVHLVTILLVWLIVFPQQQFNISEFGAFYNSSKFWVFAAGIFFLTFPSSIIIGKATSFWHVPPGLKNAGKYIGIIERILICILVYQNQYEAIGLLITGKSILRYDSRHEEEKTEYLLIGTFLSIFIAFAIGLALKFLANDYR